MVILKFKLDIVQEGNKMIEGRRMFAKKYLNPHFV